MRDTYGTRGDHIKDDCENEAHTSPEEPKEYKAEGDLDPTRRTQHCPSRYNDETLEQN